MTRPLLALAATALVFSACESTGPERTPSSLVLEVRSVDLVQGDTADVQVAVHDQHGTAFAQQPAAVTISWQSTAPMVASVQQGTIVAHNGGEALIIASAQGLKSDTLEVTVAPRMLSAEMAFSYSGSITGTFELSSTFFLHLNEPSALDWGLTYYNANEVGHDFIAVREREDGLLDLLVFWSDGAAITGPGPRPVDGGVLVLGLHGDHGTYEAFYDLAGSVQVSSVSGRQMVGTFAVDGQDEDTGHAITIQDGTFSLPLVELSR